MQAAGAGIEIVQFNPRSWSTTSTAHWNHSQISYFDPDANVHSIHRTAALVGHPVDDVAAVSAN